MPLFRKGSLVKNPSLRTLCATAAAVTITSSFIAAGQTNRRPTVPVEAALKVGSSSYDVKAPGTCTHAPKASIYNILSEQWMVRQEQDDRSVQLVFWKPADGSAPMFSLSVNGKSNATVSTVRGGQKSGSGTVKFEPAAKGGTFTVDAKAKSGEAISGTLKCETFTRAIAEGGN